MVEVPINARQFVLVGKEPLGTRVKVWSADQIFYDDFKIVISAKFPVFQIPV